jgi:peptidoglycan/LPS O-acetylase OafA/YrhL
MRDIPSLTGLRDIAAVWVMLFHVSLLAPLIGAAWLGRIGVFPVGWVGVDLFFVLSGFILMWVHGAKFVRPSGGVIGRFAVARIVRVYPLSLGVLHALGGRRWRRRASSSAIWPAASGSRPCCTASWSGHRTAGSGGCGRRRPARSSASKAPEAEGGLQPPERTA